MYFFSEKIDVNGENTHELYNWIKARSKYNIFFTIIRWNYEKFLILNNNVIGRYAPAIVLDINVV